MRVDVLVNFKYDQAAKTVQSDIIKIGNKPVKTDYCFLKLSSNFILLTVCFFSFYCAINSFSLQDDEVRRSASFDVRLLSKR